MGRGVAALLSLTCSAGLAQTIVDERRIVAVRSALEDSSPAKTLRCSMSPIPPLLNYGFRYQSGYVVSVPMKQFEGAGHRWRIVTRITPEETGKPVYLMAGYALPTIPPTKLELQVGGGYMLGEGSYYVRNLLIDEAGRSCRKDWHLEVRRRRSESKVKVAMAPGTVMDFSLRGARAPVAPDDARPMRLTILLHAAPVVPRRTRLRQSDILTLLASASTLLEHVPTTNVRLIAFNLDQQKEIYRKDGFRLGDLPSVALAMSRIELGLVDVKTLQNGRGHLETIASLINAETTDPAPADAVVVLGPMSRFGDKVPAEAIQPAPSRPQFLFFQLAPMFRPAAARGDRGPIAVADAELPDSLRHAVARVGGKTLLIRTPGELAKAIDRLEQVGSATLVPTRPETADR